MVRDIEIAPKIDDNEVIWRYMDFASFYSLLFSKELFFRRLDKYSDQYEGTLPQEIADSLVEQWATGLPTIFTKQSAKDGFNRFMAHLAEFNKGTLSNSWTASSEENYAMWKIYLRGNAEGVAIRSTVRRLREVLNNIPLDSTLAKVSYNTPDWSQSDYKTLAAFKTKPYSYESELRALVYNQFEKESVPIDVFPKVPLYQHGKALSVDVGLLIEGVHISPFAEAWFYDVVKSAIQSHLPSFDGSKIVSSRIKDR